MTQDIFSSTDELIKKYKKGLAYIRWILQGRLAVFEAWLETFYIKRINNRISRKIKEQIKKINEVLK